ncbi:hypothetical protein MMC11_003853 [Xylographa trunciseda]|nr:hypothetical protein [Xylographa trunciseda]
MPEVQATIEYLENSPLYETEKPYWCLLPPHDGFDPNKQRVDNLEFELRPDITISDIRDAKEDLTLETSGFQVLSHHSECSTIKTVEDVQAYKTETEAMLRDKLDATFVKCYELRTRKNVPFQREQFDINDPLLVEGPARGAHNDVTYGSGPVIINRHLSEEDKRLYLKPGYRFRIVNTWRSLVPVLEDRPLALCDSRSVKPEDLMEADRIIPDRVGEVYYLMYNKDHHWYWLEKQTPSEPFVFVMYDTKAGDHARCRSPISEILVFASIRVKR